MVFDRRLTWNPHLTKVISKCNRSLNIFKALRSTWWGGHPSTLLLLYKSLIRSVLEYGCQSLLTPDNNIFTKFNRIQYSALRFSLGLRTSTPIRALLAETKEPPLLIRFNFLTKKYILKCLSYSSHPVIPLFSNFFYLPLNGKTYHIKHHFILYKAFACIRNHSNTIYNSPNPLPYHFDYELQHFTPNINILEGLSIQNSSHPNNAFTKCFERNLSASHCFYTDGSKTQNGSHTGFSIFSPTLDIRFQAKINRHASIFSAEALAIYHAINFIIDKKLPSSTIFSDSQSILKTLQTSNLNAAHSRYS